MFKSCFKMGVLRLHPSFIYSLWTHRIVVIVVIISIYEVNDAGPVHGVVVPCFVSNVIHQALHTSAAGKIIRAWGCF